jgi:hypothetical protein
LALLVVFSRWAGNHGRKQEANRAIREDKMIFSNDFGLEGFNYFLIVNSVVLRM